MTDKIVISKKDFEKLKQHQKNDQSSSAMTIAAVIVLVGCLVFGVNPF